MIAILLPLMTLREQIFHHISDIGYGYIAEKAIPSVIDKIF